MNYLPIILVGLILLSVCGCAEQHNKKFPQKEQTSFWGDSVLTVISSDRPCGYNISVIKNEDLFLWHFQRGDSINQYIATEENPYFFWGELCGLTGIVLRDFDIPIQKELGGYYFFMDVNFDGEEEFVVEYNGYNRKYYACFDLANGDKNRTPCPGFLPPLNDEPYNNLVQGIECETKFDYDNKTIYISEQLGCCHHVETWSKPITNQYGETKIRIFRQKEFEYYGNGEQHSKEYKLVNDTLRLVYHHVDTLDLDLH